MNRKYMFFVLGLIIVSLVANGCSTTEARYSAPKGINAVSEIGEGNSCSQCCPESGGVVNCCSAVCNPGESPQCSDWDCSVTGYPSCECN